MIEWRLKEQPAGCNIAAPDSRSITLILNRCINCRYRTLCLPQAISKNETLFGRIHCENTTRSRLCAPGAFCSTSVGVLCLLCRCGCWNGFVFLGLRLLTIGNVILVVILKQRVVWDIVVIIKHPSSLVVLSIGSCWSMAIILYTSRLKSSR